MTDRKKALIDLRDKVKAGNADHVTDFSTAFPDAGFKEAMIAYNGPLEAAKALHEAVLPSEGWNVEWAARYPSLAFKPEVYFASVGWGAEYYAFSDDPARAWLLAILEALIAQEEKDQS